MESYIDVRGQAEIVESVATYCADLTLSVRAVQTETAAREVKDLRNQCIRMLRDAGLTEDELVEGGAEVWRPWFWRKKVGQEASRKILISCADIARLQRALGALEPLFVNQRYNLSVSMRRPLFEASPDDRIIARTQAVGDARSKAEAIARAAGLRLVTVSQVEELDAAVGSSGAYGDEYTWGTPIAVAAGEVESPYVAEPEQLAGATRTVTIRYRVRFAVEPA